MLAKKAAIVIRLFYEEERQKAKERMSLGGKGGLKEGLPDLADLPVSRDVSEELAKKAAIVIRLYYEEERQKAEKRSGYRSDLGPNLDQGGRTHEILAKKAGAGYSVVLRGRKAEGKDAPRQSNRPNFCTNWSES